MEPLVFTEPAIKPNDELVFSVIGEKSSFWKSIHSYLAANHKDIVCEWRYYNDGKSWLYRALKKEKAIIWIGVYQNSFRVTSYLGNKADSLVENSGLSMHLKETFAKTKGEKFRPVTIEVNSETDEKDVETLIEIKLKLK